MPKLNRYRALHTTVIGPQGRPLEIQVRTRDMHETAEFGIAAHWVVQARGKAKKGDDADWTAWVKQLMDWQADETDPREFIKTLRTDLFDDEVYVFTPKGEVKTLPAGSTPIDFAYSVHTDVGHRTVGAKVNGRIVPLHYRLKSGDIVEIMTSKSGRGPSRDWMSLATSSRARNKIRQWFSRETREDAEQKGREALEQALKAAEPAVPEDRRLGGARAGDPRDRLQEGGGLLRRARLGEAPGEPDRQQGDPAPEDRRGRRGGRDHAQAAEGEGHGRRARASGSTSQGVEDVLVRLAKCCTPVPGDHDRRLHLARQGDHDPPRGLPERARAAQERGAVHAGRLGGRRRRRASASRSRSTPGTARACSRTSRGRSPSTARTSSPTAAASRTSWRRTGTRPRSATSARCGRC